MQVCARGENGGDDVFVDSAIAGTAQQRQDGFAFDASLAQHLKARDQRREGLVTACQAHRRGKGAEGALCIAGTDRGVGLLQKTGKGLGLACRGGAFGAIDAGRRGGDRRRRRGHGGLRRRRLRRKVQKVYLRVG